MLIHFKKHIISIGVILFFVLIGKFGFAQQFPVQANLLISPPNTPFIADYYETGSIKLNATLILKDLSAGEREIGLKLRIEGDNGVTLSSKPTYKPIFPFAITPGVPLTISGNDWADLFNINNLSVSGISVTSLNANGVLPEGFYSFFLEVFDYRSGKIISNEARANVLIRFGGIPVVTKPNTNFVLPTEPQNILFQWVMSAPPVDPTTTQYQLKLYEITTEGVAPEVALINGNALSVFESPQQFQTILQYGPAATLLEVGKRYLYYIQVSDQNGTFTFRNNGLSEPNWFTYGYPVGGNIPLKVPENEYKFKKDDLQNFSWGIPDNKGEPSQMVLYKLKVVELTDNTQDPAQAIQNNTAFYEEESTETPSPTGWETIIDKELTKGAKYAWQVKAFSGDQEVAQSEIRTFEGPPLLTEFKAGQHLVTVLELENNDLNNLKGKGRIKLDRDGEKTVDLNFENLDLKKSGNIHVLEKGKLEGDLIGFDEITIKPLISGKGDLTFNANGVKLDAQRLQLRGKFKIPFNLPIDGEPEIITDDVYANYNNFVVTGGVPITASFNLLDPLNFEIELDTNTVINIGNTGYQIAFYGKIIPPNVSDVNGNQVEVPFINRKEIDYFIVDAVDDDIEMKPYGVIPNSELIIQPKRYIIDFSDKKSGKGKTNDWKGILVAEYKVIFGKNLDKNGQFGANNEELAFSIDESPSVVNEFLTPGINFQFNEELIGKVDGKFCTFPSRWERLNIDVKESEVKEGKITGGFIVPVINPAKYWSFEADITQSGFQEAILKGNFVGQKIVFGKENPKGKVEYTIKRAVMEDQDHINMTVDINVPELNFSHSNAKNFHAYGNYQIGFGKPNGNVDFDKTPTILYKNAIELNVDQIAAITLDNKYFNAFGAYFNVSEDISGEDGPLGLEMFSAKESGVENEVPTDYSNSPVISPSSAQLAVDPKDVQFFDSTYAILDCKIAQLQGMIKIKEGVPGWGTVFSGSLNGYAYAPSKIEAGAKLITGRLENDMKYWIANIYAMDKGVGVPVVPGYVNMVALEGMLFRHMKPTLSDNGRTVTIVPDKNVDYGGGLYTQLIDAQTYGVNVKADIGVEMLYGKDGYDLKMLGESTIYNLKGRTVAGDAGDVVLDEIVKEVVEKINEQCIEYGDWEFCPNIDTDLQGGRLKAVNGSTTIKAGGKVNPKVGEFYFDNDEWLVDLAGSSNAIKINLNKKKGNDAFSVGLSYLPQDSASIDFGYPAEQLTVGGAYLFNQEAARMKFGYGDVLIKGRANKSEKSGNLNVAIGNSLGFGGAFNYTEKSGSLFVKNNNDEYALEAAQRGYGKITIKNGSKSALTEFDKDKKEALFTFEEKGDFTIDAFGSPDTGRFNLTKEGEYQYKANFSKQTSSGGMAFIIDENNKYKARINVAQNSGHLEITNPKAAFKLGASKEASSAYFNMNLPSGEVLLSNANLANKTGLFDLTFSEGHFIASLHTDSARFLAEPKDDFTFETAVHEQGKGLAHYAKNGEFIHLNGKAEGYALYKMDMSGVKLLSEVSKTNQTARFALDLGTDTMNAGLNVLTEDAYLNAFFDGIYVGSYVKNGNRGGVIYNDQTRLIELGGGEGFGKVRYAEAGNLFHVESDKENNFQVGRGKLDTDSIYTYRNISTNEIDLKTKYSNYSSGASFNGVDACTAYYGDGTRTINGLVNAQGYGNLLYQEPTILGFISKDEENSAKLRFRYQTDSLNSYINPNDKEVGLTFKFDKYYVRTLAAERGDGLFIYADQDRRIKTYLLNKNEIGVSFLQNTDSFYLKSNFDNKTVRGDIFMMQKYFYGEIVSENAIKGGFEFDNRKGDAEIDVNGFNSISYSDLQYKLEVSGNQFTAPRFYFGKDQEYIELERTNSGSIILGGNYQGEGYTAEYNSNNLNQISFTQNSTTISGKHTSTTQGSIVAISPQITLTANQSNDSNFVLINSGNDELKVLFQSSTIVELNNNNQSFNGANSTYSVNGISVSVSASQVSLNYPENTLTVQKTDSSFNAQFGSKQLAYKNNNEIELRFSPEISTSVTRNTLKANYYDAVAEVENLETMSISYHQYKADAKPGVWTISRNDTSLALKIEKEAVLKVGQNKQLTVNTEKVEAIYENYLGEVTINKTAKFLDGTREVNAGELWATYKEGQISGRIDANLVEAEFQYDPNKKGTANLEKITVQYDNYKGAVGIDSSAYFTDGTFLGDLQNQELLVKEIPKNRFVKANAQEKFIEVNDGERHEAKATEKDLIGRWEDYQFGVGIDTMLYIQHLDKFFRVKGQDLALKYDDVEVNYYREKKLTAKYAENSFYASLPELLVKGNYQNYEAGVGFEEGVWYKDGVREGLVDWDKVYFKYDDRKGTAWYNKYELELEDGNRRTFSGSTNHIKYVEKEQQEGDYSFLLSETEGLVYDDPWNKFHFLNDLDVTIKKLPDGKATQAVGEIKIGIKNLIEGEKEFFMQRKAGNSQGGSQGIAFNKNEGFKATWDYNGDNNFVAIGGDLSYFGFKLWENEVYAKSNFLLAKRGDYGLGYGGNYIGKVFYQNDSIMLSDNSTDDESLWELGFRDGDKGIAINTIGEITVLNKNQKIIAGGEKPMRFENPDAGMAEDKNSTADFAFNLAGLMDFSVEPMPNNDVKIYANTDIAKFGIQSYGQGRLTCEVYPPEGLGTGKLGTLYKNQYTWGVALGNEEADVEGPDVGGGEVEMAGPKNIGKITANSNSLFQVKTFAHYSQKTETFILNGAVTATKPMLCLDNMTLKSKFSSDSWYIKIADRPKDKWAGVRPFCLDIGEPVGFFYADNTGLIEAGAELNFSEEISTGWFPVIPKLLEAKLSAYYKLRLGGVASVDLNPFSIQKINVFASAKAGIDACGDTPAKSLGCTTLIAVSIEGDLLVVFDVEKDGENSVYKGGKIKGKVKGCVEIFDEDFCGNFEIETEI